MRAEIREYDPGDWPALAAFLRDHWSGRHPVLNRALFDWQYAGFGTGGEGRPPPRTLLLWDRGRLAGFLGLIPGCYQVNSGGPALAGGCSLAMWMVHPELQRCGLGLLLLQRAEDRFEILHCLGANAEAGGYYGRRGYACCPRLDRWVGPLAAAAYTRLLAAEVAPDRIRGWQERLLDGDAAPPASPGAEELARLWLRGTRGDDRWVVQGLHRNAAFWRWRYLESRGFRYLFFGHAPRGPVVVARVEEVPARRTRALRVVEMLPADPAAWAGGPDADLVRLLRGVLVWAAEQGCCAADYQAAGGVLRSTLAAAGLRAQSDPVTADPPASLAPVLDPLLPGKPPINAYWRVSGSGACSGRWYFPKTDGDMDRPHGTP